MHVETQVQLKTMSQSNPSGSQPYQETNMKQEINFVKKLKKKIISHQVDNGITVVEIIQPPTYVQLKEKYAATVKNQTILQRLAKVLKNQKIL